MPSRPIKKKGRRRRKSNDELTSLDQINWVLKNYPAAEKHAVDNEGKLDTFPAPSSTHTAYMILALEDPRYLGKLVETKSRLEQYERKVSRVRRAMRDDMRKHFRLLDMLESEMPTRLRPNQCTEPAATVSISTVEQSNETPQI